MIGSFLTKCSRVKGFVPSSRQSMPGHRTYNIKKPPEYRDIYECNGRYGILVKGAGANGVDM